MSSQELSQPCPLSFYLRQGCQCFPAVALDQTELLAVPCTVGRAHQQLAREAEEVGKQPEEGNLSNQTRPLGASQTPGLPARHGAKVQAQPVAVQGLRAWFRPSRLR